jgi:hypothetical protein
VTDVLITIFNKFFVQRHIRYNISHKNHSAVYLVWNCYMQHGKFYVQLLDLNSCVLRNVSEFLFMIGSCII